MPKTYSKRCSTKAMSKNVAHFIRDEGWKANRAVAASYNILKKACGCAVKRRLTPKQIVACGKRSRGQRARSTKRCTNGARA